MIHRLKATLRGSVCLSCAPTQKGYAWILNLLSRLEIPFWNQRISQNEMTFCVFSQDAKRIAEQAEAKQLSVLWEKGLPRLLRRYRLRFGVPLGILCFACLLFLSGRFVWRVEVSGAEQVPKEEILLHLEELGCGVGAYLPNLDGYRLSKAYLQKDPRIAWISVNLVGNVVKVSVREAVEAPPKESPMQAANLVAKEDGMIVSYALNAGQAVGSVGASVKKGELLVSGLVENKNGTYTLSCAQGEVFAKVSRTLSVEIPQKISKTVRTDHKKTEKMIKIFGKTIKFSKSSGNSEAKYDTIRKVKEITLFGRIVLPITYYETTYYETETVTVDLSQEEMLAMAKAELQSQYQALQQSAKKMLYAGTVTETPTQNGLCLTQEVWCIVDIAEQREIKLPTQQK